MIVRQLNKVNVDRIIKAGDIEKLLSIEGYAQHRETQAEQLMVQVTAEIEEMKQQAYQETVTELVDSNQQILADLEKRLTKLLSNINQELQGVILQVLVILGLEDLSPINLSTLLSAELDRFKQVEKVKLEAHPTAIETLKQSLAKFVDSCEFEANPRMSGLECICTTHFWSLRLDINSVVTKLTNLLTPPPKTISLPTSFK